MVFSGQLAVSSLDSLLVRVACDAEDFVIIFRTGHRGESPVSGCFDRARDRQRRVKIARTPARQAAHRRGTMLSWVVLSFVWFFVGNRGLYVTAGTTFRVCVPTGFVRDAHRRRSSGRQRFGPSSPWGTRTAIANPTPPPAPRKPPPDEDDFEKYESQFDEENDASRGASSDESVAGSFLRKAERVRGRTPTGSRATKRPASPITTKQGGVSSERDSRVRLLVGKGRRETG